MKRHKFVIGIGLLTLLLTLSDGEPGQAADKLGQPDLVKLLELGIDEAAIVDRINKGGIAFEVNDAVLEKLKKAGASNAVLKAVEAAAKPKPNVPAADAVTYEQVLQLLELQIDEAAILRRLEKSPTIFTLDAGQVEALKKAGASEKLLAAMAGQRSAPSQAGDITDLAIILDCSGSMKEVTTGGETKMAVARRVVTDLVQAIPEGLNVAFVIYGHEVFGGAEDPRNCRAVKVARPLGPLGAAGKRELGQLIDRLQPTGATPIALSLQTAGTELAKNKALCGLVLITDGVETCQGDPAAESAALAANLHVTFGVNVVGFGVKPEENAALKSIADAGNGTYYAAADAKALGASIAAIAQQIQAKAKPPEVVDVSRRAFRILAPEVELPEMKEIFLVEEGRARGVFTKTASISKYGEYLAVPSSTKKYDVLWVPKTGFQVYMLRSVSIPDRRVVNVKPAEVFGMIVVSGTGKVRNVFAMPTGVKPAGAFEPTSQVENLGETLVVAASTYDVYVRTESGTTALIEEGLEVAAGKLVQLQY